MTKQCPVLVVILMFWIGVGHACDLKITELNAQNRSPWLEVFNASETACDVSGLTFSRFDGFNQSLAWHVKSDQETIKIPSGQYAVFSRDQNLGADSCLKEDLKIKIYEIRNKKFKFLKKTQQKICISGSVNNSQKLFDCVSLNFKRQKKNLNLELNKSRNTWSKSTCVQKINKTRNLNFKFYGTPGYDNSECQEVFEFCENKKLENNNLVKLTYEPLPEVDLLENISLETSRIILSEDLRENLKNNFGLTYPIEIYAKIFFEKNRVKKYKLENLDKLESGKYKFEICAENIFADKTCEEAREVLEIKKTKLKSNQPRIKIRNISNNKMKIILNWSSENNITANARLFTKKEGKKIIIGLFGIGSKASNHLSGEQVFYLPREITDYDKLWVALQGDFEPIEQVVDE